MRRSSSPTNDETGAIFDRSVELIRSTLVSHYRLTDEEARGAEEDLRVWFQRLLRRGTSPPTESVLEVALISAACQYGRSLQLWKLQGQPSPDDKLNALLARQPDDVARDVRQRFETERA